MTGLPDLTWTPAPDFRARPFPVSPVTQVGWIALADALAAGRFSLLGLWACESAVQMALHDAAAKAVAVARLDGLADGFPSVGRRHPAAQRMERAAADLFGLRPLGAEDARPWLDHGAWEIAYPMGAATPHPGPAPYPFLPVQGESLHVVPVGPVHAGIIEPGHFRFTAQGETVVRLEERLGYVHKGVDRLMRGAELDKAARLAGRVSGDSTVAYAWAFAQAVEAALETPPPPRAVHLRAVMAELERLANHLGDIGAICNDAAFAMMLAHGSVLREKVLRAAHAAFGHRFMRDRIIPGGVAVDLDASGTTALRGLIGAIRDRFPAIVALYDNTPSLLDRTVATGRLSAELVRRFGAGGHVGRASGRDFDARRDLTYAPYDALAFEVPVLDAGDVNARIWVRIREVEQSCALIERMLADLPEGPIAAPCPPATELREGLGLVESFRGDVLAWVSLAADGTVARCWLRDPSWFQWPLLEAAIEGDIIADFPLCNKSFNCSYSGHDL